MATYDERQQQRRQQQMARLGVFNGRDDLEMIHTLKSLQWFHRVFAHVGFKKTPVFLMEGVASNPHEWAEDLMLGIKGKKKVIPSACRVDDLLVWLQAGLMTH